MLAGQQQRMQQLQQTPCAVRSMRSARPCVRCASSSNGSSSSKPVILEVKDLTAKIVETGQQILNGVNLTIHEGEVHAIMGKNGSGKSTLSKVLVGHPDYEVTGGTAVFKGKDLFELDPEERSHEGLFLSFQSPIEIPGVSNVDFLRMACNARRKSLGQSELDPLEFYAYVIPKVWGPWDSSRSSRSSSSSSNRGGTTPSCNSSCCVDSSIRCNIINSMCSSYGTTTQSAAAPWQSCW
jgi:hypothetical protein